MSAENIEIVRQSLDAYNRRDFDGIRALNASDIELDWSASRGPEAGVYRGVDDVIAFYRNFLAAWQLVEIEPDDFIAAGDSVVVPNTAHLRGRDGIETVARGAFVFDLRDGRIARIRLFQETRAALEAVGLSESST
jgi:uncharacterized protein